MTIENQTRIAQAKIVIIKGTMDSIPLIGRPTLEDLGMIKMDETGGLKEPNNSRSEEIARIKKVQGNQGNLTKFYAGTAHDFKGLERPPERAKKYNSTFP